MAEQPQKPADLTLPDELASQLREEFMPKIEVSAAIDDAVLSMARDHLQQQRRPRRRAWWLSAGAAVAAALMLAVVLQRDPEVSPRVMAPSATTAPEPEAMEQGDVLLAQEDIDRNGRVDILDAFLLARRLERNESTDSWDLNHDGQVNRLDVTAVAMAAVRLDGGVTQ